MSVVKEIKEIKELKEVVCIHGVRAEDGSCNFFSKSLCSDYPKCFFNVVNRGDWVNRRLEAEWEAMMDGLQESVGAR